MFKKVEIWILYLTILLSIVLAVSFGVLVRQELVGTTKVGWISKVALFLAETPVNFKRALSGSKNDLELEDRFSTLNSFDGMANSKETYLLLSRYDGNLQEGIVELVDLTKFQTLHTWNPDIDAFNDLVEEVDEFKYLKRDHNNKRKVLMHPKLTRDNGLLFGWDSPLHKIDACSNLIFQNKHDQFHHSIETDVEGNIWVSSHLNPPTDHIERVGKMTNKELGFYDDAIVKMSPEGEILFEKSVIEIFIENGMEYLLFAHGNYYEEDPIHLNDIQPVNFDGEFWKKGDVFLSLRNQSMIILYRPSTNKIIWKGVGPFLHQHDVDILDDSRISVFNNRSLNVVGDCNLDRNAVDGNSEVIIFDFKTRKYSSFMKDSLKFYDVRTISEGGSQILPNGDMFIEESNYGRTIYFNNDGSLRWTHVNRAHDGNVYRIGWSRILYTTQDIQTVKHFLNTQGKCDD